LLKYTIMMERLPQNGVDLSSWNQYSGSSLNVNARAYVMDRYSKPRIDINAETINSLRLGGMEPDGTVLDAGCSNGSWLLDLGGRHGHTGQMIGVDDSLNSLDIGKENARNNGITNVRFEKMDARTLAFPDDTFDAFSAQNLLYHVNDYEKAIAELVRTAKYGAPGIISTKGDFHQIRIWQANERIAPKLSPPYEGAQKPKMPGNFYEPFDTQDATGILARYFEVIPELSIKHETVIIIPPEGWLDYKQALLSLKDSYDPIPRGPDIEQLIDGEIKDIFDREIAHKGFYVDYMQCVSYLCRNTKKYV
jgi:SAM-dependent methyltransferase